jgi:hypothetical protein
LPYQRIARAIVTDWRAAASDLREVDDDTMEAAELHAEIERLRTEYQDLVEEALENHRPAPPPFVTIAKAKSD